MTKANAFDNERISLSRPNARVAMKMYNYTNQSEAEFYLFNQKPKKAKKKTNIVSSSKVESLDLSEAIDILNQSET